MMACHLGNEVSVDSAVRHQVPPEKVLHKAAAIIAVEYVDRVRGMLVAVPSFLIALAYRSKPLLVLFRWDS